LIGSRIVLRDISTKSIVTLLTEDRDPPFISRGMACRGEGGGVRRGGGAAGRRRRAELKQGERGRERVEGSKP
jgi:hypothetical protein